jgi:hypothetical protein
MLPAQQPCTNYFLLCDVLLHSFCFLLSELLGGLGIQDVGMDWRLQRHFIGGVLGRCGGWDKHSQVPRLAILCQRSWA